MNVTQSASSQDQVLNHTASPALKKGAGMGLGRGTVRWSQKTTSAAVRECIRTGARVEAQGLFFKKAGGGGEACKRGKKKKSDSCFIVLSHLVQAVPLTKGLREGNKDRKANRELWSGRAMH